MLGLIIKDKTVFILLIDKVERNNESIALFHSYCFVVSGAKNKSMRLSHPIGEYEEHWCTL